MCGIVAILGEEAATTGSQMLDSLRHRGPDGAGSLQLTGCFLAMTRLAILDPTARSDQPMSWEGRHLVYNGELYNYRALRSELAACGVEFHTSGDTEVVLKALVKWGPAACERFSGMFAFALWDEQRRELVVARDRYGVKPLYWRTLDGGWVGFASEATPLAAIAPAPPTLAAVREFLRFGSPISECIYGGVTEIEPGTVTTWSSTGVRSTPFGTSPVRPAEGPSQLRQVACEYVASDRPLVLFLSGGFDSAAVAAALVSHGHAPAALSLGLSGNEDDIARARHTASHYGLDHSVHHIGLSDVQEMLPSFLSAMDQPTVDGFNTYLVSRVANDLGYPVALSGLGGDEVMGGYGYYRWRRQVDVVSALWRHSPSPARTAAGVLASRVLRRPAAEFTDILGARSVEERHRAWRSIFSAHEVARLTGADAPPSGRWASDPAQSPHAQLTRLDFETYLRPTLLRDTDVFSMANSVEMRVPLLDHRFVESSLGASPPLTKTFLASMWSDEYLVRLAGKPKLTFGLPWRDWIRSVVDEESDMLGSDDPWAGLVDPAEARLHFGPRDADRPRDALRSWALIVLARWLARPPASRRIEGRRA